MKNAEHFSCASRPVRNSFGPYKGLGAILLPDIPTLSGVESNVRPFHRGTRASRLDATAFVIALIDAAFLDACGPAASDSGLTIEDLGSLSQDDDNADQAPWDLKCRPDPR